MRIAAMGRSISEAADLLERQYDGTAEKAAWDGLLPDDALWDVVSFDECEPAEPDPSGEDGWGSFGEKDVVFSQRTLPFDADALPGPDPFRDDGWTIFDEEDDRFRENRDRCRRFVLEDEDGI